MVDTNRLIFRNLAHTMRALSSAQKPIVDETTADLTENDEMLSLGRDRYQIVNSCLPADGEYQIDKCTLIDQNKKKKDYCYFQYY